jgi:hypothetical protein
LVDLRDTEIVKAFSDTPKERGLLNPNLLDEFVRKRSRTRDEWLHRIPYEYRTKVDAKQVRQYLDRVLDIIGAHVHPNGQ